MKKENLVVIGANENNLKNISVSIPARKITTISGVSGAGKSSLARAVIYENYCRIQRLSKNVTYDKLVRPNFVSVNNPFKTIIVTQKNLLSSEASTVATISGVNTVIRNILFKDGVIHCKKCATTVDNFASIQTITKLLKKLKSDDVKISISILKNSFLNIDHVESFFKKYPISQVKVSGKKKPVELSYIYKLDINKKYSIEGLIEITDFLLLTDIPTHLLTLYKKDELACDFSKQTFCKHCLQEFYVKNMSLFTKSTLSEFNGCCGLCKGRGMTLSVKQDKLFNNNALSEVFLNIPHDDTAYKYCFIQDSQLRKIINRSHNKNISKFSDLEPAIKNELVNYITQQLTAHANNKYISAFLEMTSCLACNGTGFNDKANAVYVNSLNISDLLDLDIKTLTSLFDKPKLKEIYNAFSYLIMPDMNLGRLSTTLSGGELQRLKLIRFLSEDIEDNLIIVDEPSKGLSVSDILHVFSFFKKIAEKNTVVLIDHSSHIIKNADYNLNFGPVGGTNGGYITKEDFEDLPVNNKTKTDCLDFLEIKNINCNTVVNQEIKLPYLSLTAIFGVSGGGKSSLVKGIVDMLPDIRHEFDSFIYIDQKEINANYRSTVASYLDIMDVIRESFCNASVAKVLKLSKEHFSSNTAQGKCLVCDGTGKLDNTLCYSCSGDKLNFLSTLVTIDNKNICEYLAISINELKDTVFYDDLKQVIDLLITLGLGYLSLNRETSSLSGGEAQRIKLIKYLNSSGSDINSLQKHTLIILDEPMRGLSTRDAKDILSLLTQIRDCNNTVLLIEHNPEVIFSCDYLIELGPSSGQSGGKVIFLGLPESYKKNKTIKVSDKVKPLFDGTIGNYQLSMEDEYFARLKKFQDSFSVVELPGLFLCRSKDELYEKIKNHKEYYFNPFGMYLNKNTLIAKTTVNFVFDSLSTIGFKEAIVEGEKYALAQAQKKINSLNVFSFKLLTDDFNLAFEFGAGWISVLIDNHFFDYSTRLIDVSEQVIGSRLDKRSNHFFNLYFNRCPHCSGTGELMRFKHLHFNENKDLLDIDLYPEFLRIDIKKQCFRLKESLTTFEKEGMIDCKKEYRNLSQNDVNVFLWGIPDYSFLKDKGRKMALEDNIRWGGVFDFLNSRLHKFSVKTREVLSGMAEPCRCHFCNGSRYSREFNYYSVGGKRIWEYLE